MKVLVDTSVWSLALRKKTLTDNEKKIVNELKELIYELRPADDTATMFAFVK